jgi:hypothetical protein
VLIVRSLWPGSALFQDRRQLFKHPLSVQVVDMLLGKFKNARQSWVTTLQRASTTLFWILALISLAWTGVVMVLKRSDLLEICAEVVRYLIFTGFFFWLLQNGPAFANDIIRSLRQLGGISAPAEGVNANAGTASNAALVAPGRRRRPDLIPFSLRLSSLQPCGADERPPKFPWGREQAATTQTGPAITCDRFPGTSMARGDCRMTSCVRG